MWGGNSDLKKAKMPIDRAGVSPIDIPAMRTSPAASTVGPSDSQSEVALQPPAPPCLLSGSLLDARTSRLDAPLEADDHLSMGRRGSPRGIILPSDQTPSPNNCNGGYEADPFLRQSLPSATCRNPPETCADSFAAAVPISRRTKASQISEEQTARSPIAASSRSQNALASDTADFRSVSGSSWAEISNPYENASIRAPDRGLIWKTIRARCDSLPTNHRLLSVTRRTQGRHRRRARLLPVQAPSRPENAIYRPEVISTYATVLILDQIY